MIAGKGGCMKENDEGTTRDAVVKMNSKLINKQRAHVGPILCFILFTVLLSTAIGGCATLQSKEIKDEISHLSFSHDGKKVLFDRCRNDDCQIQVYDLETGELAAYQSPHNEQWTMARQSYDGKKIVFSVIPAGEKYLDLTQMQIAVMDTDGKNYKKLTSSPFPKLYPTFSHSGKKVLYVKANRMRREGRTPASKYDAWEVDIETGKETRLTYFEYFYMNSVCYYPDDEHFLYYADGPFAFPGLELPKDDINKALQMIGEEAHRRKVYLVGVLKMKRGEDLPTRPYIFDVAVNPPIRPLLSKDGTKLIFEKSASSGKFYLYSDDWKHKPVGGGGSINSAALSPDGKLLGIISVSKTIDTFTAQDGKRKHILYLPCAPKTIENWPKDMRGEAQRLNTEFKMIPEKPLRILNH
jgi:WD40 repeat protein